MKSFSHLTDEEFLRELDGVRHQSPIIADLCRRLEETKQEPATASCECPVCMADLRADYDVFNETLELKVNV